MINFVEKLQKEIRPKIAQIEVEDKHTHTVNAV